VTSPGTPNALPPLVVVDAANVVGSVPDGWWRDRVGATERLRDKLRELAGTGLPPEPGVPEWATRPPLDLVLVVEGAARAVQSLPAGPDGPGVGVIAAERTGDDAIVELVKTSDNPRKLVVTADRALRERVTALGAEVVGPRTVRRPHNVAGHRTHL
jgi:hypothetical protein